MAGGADTNESQDTREDTREDEYNRLDDRHSSASDDEDNNAVEVYPRVPFK